ncbi:4-alpha-glucanotransferase [Streptomyces sp. NRRL S-87]|uniref:4-alpha-glucanotransferase n=1 Tax=Streptomyces sp. NRRL S-87 TaxID=1463920 RepID=UPI0004BF9FBD|nr:4-alpha-glucanotransferase [Streptomyces sp. NRRL S-87]
MGLARLAAAHGVATSYEPSHGVTVPVADATVVAVLAALGVDASTPQAVEAALAAADCTAASLLPPTVVHWVPLSALPRTGDDPARARPAAPGTRTAPATPAAPTPARTPDTTAAVPPALAGLPPGTRVVVDLEEGGRLEWTVTDAGGAAPAAAPLPPGTEPGTEPGAEPGAGRRLPLGVHRVHAAGPDGRAGEAVLVVAPERAPEPPRRAHGLLVQLYSLLSHRSWGMGDLADLAELAAWAGRTHGAGFVQVNPLHSAVPGTPTDPSPYRPSSRRFPDPVHLRVEDVPEHAYAAPADRTALDALAARAAALREEVLVKGALIDRDAVWELKRQALEVLYAVPRAPGRAAAFEAFLAEQGPDLTAHARWCALAEGRAEDPARVDFHRWLAWLTDGQLATAQRAAREAGMPLGLVHDLAVGVHPEGADAWARPEAFAAGMSVGAPPDAFNARGQDWGLPPWRPDALAAAGYAPYRGLLRGLFRHAGALRIDHVMGLFRLWWVPAGRPPTEGTYVAYDAEAMLAVLVLEAHRAGAVVIGEDLGTVQPAVRRTLARHGVLGTSVLWFERDWAGDGLPLPPGRWRSDCLATATTHDLPPSAARLSGEHVELRHRLGLLTRPADEERAADAAETAEWLTTLERLGLDTKGEEAAVRALYAFLLRTPARLVGIWLPDGVGDRRPQNLPGTWDEYPNWRLPVAGPDGRPLALEDLTASPRLNALLEAVRAGTR